MPGGVMQFPAGNKRPTKKPFVFFSAARDDTPRFNQGQWRPPGIKTDFTQERAEIATSKVHVTMYLLQEPTLYMHLTNMTST